MLDDFHTSPERGNEKTSIPGRAGRGTFPVSSEEEKEEKHKLLQEVTWFQSLSAFNNPASRIRNAFPPRLKTANCLFSVPDEEGRVNSRLDEKRGGSPLFIHWSQKLRASAMISMPAVFATVSNLTSGGSTERRSIKARSMMKPSVRI